MRPLQYYVLTLDPNMPHVVHWIRANSVDCEVHLNRTRFWLQSGTPLHTEFLLRFSHCCPQVDPTVDLATGL